ncbi:unnamed protein product [Brachionus calyciflorus]|uniref:Ubiquitin-conjugating enzyme E2C-binding protein n=1 Tax=Brachionus calyciflorus TaxID=104777 RepID=A0A813P1Y9_9BILA|nr:unnamed protein product [Brachionus calyciflorus]
MNLYAEYLENLQQLNLIFSAESQHISEYNIDGEYLNIEFKDINNQNVRINLQNFEFDPKNLKEIKLNSPLESGHKESIFRLNGSLKERPTRIADLKDLIEINSIKCLVCQNEILNKSQKFTLLKLPDNDLDELADNFFCHLHSHDHNHNTCDHESGEDLTNILNPLRDSNKLRKSILGNMTILILNLNHLDTNGVKEENLDLKCSSCGFNLGYKRLKTNEFFIWKSNVVLNNDPTTNTMYLGSLLGQGRYLIESKKCPNKSIYLWILNENAIFKHFKMGTQDVQLNLQFQNNVKKCLFKILENNESDLKELKNLRNDCNVNLIQVSNEQFNNINEVLISSNNELCQSLKKSNDFYFGII